MTSTDRETETVTVRFKWLRPPLSKRVLQIILQSAYEYTCVGAPYCTRDNNILVEFQQSRHPLHKNLLALPFDNFMINTCVCVPYYTADNISLC